MVELLRRDRTLIYEGSVDMGETFDVKTNIRNFINFDVVLQGYTVPCCKNNYGTDIYGSLSYGVDDVMYTICCRIKINNATNVTLYDMTRTHNITGEKTALTLSRIYGTR